MRSQVEEVKRAAAKLRAMKETDPKLIADAVEKIYQALWAIVREIEQPQPRDRP